MRQRVSCSAKSFHHIGHATPFAPSECLMDYATGASTAIGHASPFSLLNYCDPIPPQISLLRPGLPLPVSANPSHRSSSPGPSEWYLA